MKLCMIRRTCLSALQRPRGSPRNWPAILRQSRLYSSLPVQSISPEPVGSTRRNALSESRRYDVFDKISPPKERRSADAWVALLEPALPPHLQQLERTQTTVNPSAEDIAEILLAAQRVGGGQPGIDLLLYLGVEKERWTAVVWLVKQLVETFGTRDQSSRLSKTLTSWTSEERFLELLRHPIDTTRFSARASSNLQSLDELTDKAKPEDYSRNEILRHDALGQIWRSLGKMTIACVDAEIKPEILEIIAYLHHVGIMPTSIYNAKASADATLIQQPPILNLFSSRILTSLSDAAWRAREKLVVEEKTKVNVHATLGPELPGTAYRFNVAGLRPELWLELILWSCLHGGWIVEGAAILHTLYLESDPRRWKPLSWRSLIRDAELSARDWDKFEYLFKTDSNPTMDGSAHSLTLSARRSISSEVVNAFVDALVGNLRVGVGERGVAPALVLSYLTAFKKFLARSNLSLGSGSWESVILRFIDTQEGAIHQKDNFKQLMSLSPAMGEESSSGNVRELPAYVFDGSAALLGLFHRALESRIDAGDVRGAFEIFGLLRKMADNNQRHAVLDFLKRRSLFDGDRSNEETGLFTNNFSGIQYPAFSLQIPPQILGRFLELITDAKAYDFGKWLLYAEDLDGPAISEQLYTDPIMTSALIRFATETQDTSLLTQLVQVTTSDSLLDGPQLPRKRLQSFFDSQINLKRWDAAVRILETMRDKKYAHWNVMNLAHVVRAMLLQVRKAEAGDTRHQDDLAQTKTIFSDMVLRKYERENERPNYAQRQATTISIILSTLNNQWAQFCQPLVTLNPFYTFTLPNGAFNLILEGVVGAYGSFTGRQLLDRFWPDELREAQDAERRLFKGEIGRAYRERIFASPLQTPDRARSVLVLPSAMQDSVVLYGGLSPNLRTLRIIFGKALDDIKTSQSLTESEEDDPESSAVEIDNAPSGIMPWMAERLQSMGFSHEEILDEIKRTLKDQGMQHLVSEIPEWLRADVDQGFTSSEQTEPTNLDDDDTYPPFVVDFGDVEEQSSFRNSYASANDNKVKD